MSQVMVFWSNCEIKMPRNSKKIFKKIKMSRKFLALKWYQNCLFIGTFSLYPVKVIAFTQGNEYKNEWDEPSNL